MNHHRIHQTLNKFTHSRLALSTVVTSLIVLVISVLLAGVVTYFAINVTSTRVQEESLVLAKQHVWFDFASSKTQAAIMIINSGGRDVVIEKLTVRGQQCDWSKVFFNQTTASVSGDLSYASSLSDGTALSIGGTSYTFKQASSAITLQSGRTLLIYLNSPDSISVNDIGLTVSVNIFTSQAMYYKETNVQGTSGTTTTSLPTTFTIIDAAAYYDPDWTTTDDLDEVGMVLYNGGDTMVTIGTYDFKINGTRPGVGMTLYGLMDVSNPSSLVFVGADAEFHGETLYDLSVAGILIGPGQYAIAYFAWSTTDPAFVGGDTLTVSVDLSIGGNVGQTVTAQAV